MRASLAILCLAAAVTAACDSHGPFIAEQRRSPEYALAYTRALVDYDVLYSAILFIHLPDSDTSFALTPDSLWPEVLDPQWSPDGTSILFYFGREYESLSLWTVDTRTRRRRMLYDDGCVAHSAHWSPDATRIIFLSTCEPAGINAESTLHVVDVESGAVDRLDGPMSNFSAPRWSPNGHELLVAGTIRRIGLVGNGLWLRSDVDQSWHQLFMTTARIRDAAWSPDGTRVAFTLASGQVLVIDREGPSSVATLSTEDNNRWPTWSPDGSMIAFRRRSTVRVVDFYGQLWAIYGAPYPWEPPSWSPDGARITLSADRGIDEVDVRTGEVTTVLSEEEIVFRSPIWSPVPWSEIQSSRHDDE